MYDLDTYPDTVPDLSDILRYTLPDEADTVEELARLDERASVYHTLQSFGMLSHARKPA